MAYRTARVTQHSRRMLAFATAQDKFIRRTSELIWAPDTAAYLLERVVERESSEERYKLVIESINIAHGDYPEPLSENLRPGPI